MPLYKEWKSDTYSLSAIWKIEEPESFFLSQTGIHTSIKNPKRRLEHLAGRYLLKHVEQDFPLFAIKPDEHDKPRIDENQFFFSISHSYPYVAVVVSPYVECGIDIQVWHPRMSLLQQKFLSLAEQKMFQGNDQWLTMAWCAKEAAYKWQGKRGVEFNEHLEIKNFQNNATDFDMEVHLHLMSPSKLIMAKSFIDDGFACSYIVNNDELTNNNNK